MNTTIKMEPKKDFNLLERIMIGVFATIGLLMLLSGCSSAKPYNTVYTIKAEQIIRGKSYIRGYDEHVISDKAGNVYRIFQAPAQKKDSIYKIAKRMSYGRERSIQFYYKVIKPKKRKR